MSWSIQARITCPDKLVPKHPHWSRLRDELLAKDWNLLLCSAGSLSAILCDHARQMGRRALDVGAFDERFFQNSSKACNKSPPSRI